MIIILFGLSGSGKSYIGNLIAENFGFLHLDGDQFLTSEMLTAIEKMQVFTQAQVDYYTDLLINKVQEYHQVSSKIVISQGLYRAKNRLEISNRLSNIDEVVFVQVNSVLREERIKNRDNLISKDYAKRIELNFEEMKNALQIENSLEGSEHILAQLNDLLK